MMDIKTEDKQFWMFYLMTCFPFASDDELEIMLDEFLLENYELDIPRIDNGNETEPWDGSSIHVKINDTVTLHVELHTSEATYFLNNVWIGNTGGNFELSLLSWLEFKAIARDSRNLFMLLLPFVVGSISEHDEIFDAIKNNLLKLPLEFENAHIDTITRFLVSHLIFEDETNVGFEDDAEFGVVCNRNHSRRNKNSAMNMKEEIKEINKLIKLAMKD